MSAQHGGFDLPELGDDGGELNPMPGKQQGVETFEVFRHPEGDGKRLGVEAVEQAACALEAQLTLEHIEAAGEIVIGNCCHVPPA
jgi:hypothetical protein